MVSVKILSNKEEVLKTEKTEKRSPKQDGKSQKSIKKAELMSIEKAKETKLLNIKKEIDGTADNFEKDTESITDDREKELKLYICYKVIRFVERSLKPLLLLIIALIQQKHDVESNIQRPSELQKHDVESNVQRSTEKYSTTTHVESEDGCEPNAKSDESTCTTEASGHLNRHSGGAVCNKQNRDVEHNIESPRESLKRAIAGVQSEVENTLNELVNIIISKVFNYQDKYSENKLAFLISDIVTEVSNLTQANIDEFRTEINENNMGLHVVSRGADNYSYNDVVELTFSLTTMNGQTLKECQGNKNQLYQTGKIHVTLNVIQREVFENAVRQVEIEISVLSYCIYHPPECRMPAAIPILVGKYIHRKEQRP